MDTHTESRLTISDLMRMGDALRSRWRGYFGDMPTLASSLAVRQSWANAVKRDAERHTDTLLRVAAHSLALSLDDMRDSEIRVTERLIGEVADVVAAEVVG